MSLCYMCSHLASTVAKTLYTKYQYNMYSLTQDYRRTNNLFDFLGLETNTLIARDNNNPIVISIYYL